LAYGFSDKIPPCFTYSCAIESQTKEVAKTSEDKKKVCGMIYDPTTGDLLGAAQLQFEGMEGNLSLVSSFRHKCKPKECYLETIVVSEAARGKGIGSKLLKWCDEQALANECKEITLEVLAANKGATALYERKGYVIDPKSDSFVDSFIEAACLGVLFCRCTTTHFMRKSLI